jgi:hypothetical protein
MLLRRCVFLAFCLVLCLYLLRDPNGAAHTVKAVLRGLTLAADALDRFASSL